MQVKIKKMKQQGFTLIEVMVVIVILGVLAALTVPDDEWESRKDIEI